MQLTLRKLSSILDTREGGGEMLYNIKDIRLKNNLTQEELAKKANISRATVIKLESGEEMEVKISTLEALADALDCPVSAFFMQ